MEWRFTLSDIDMGEEDIAAVTDVLRSKWLTMGSVTAAFERSFAEKVGVKHAFAVTNCTAALHLANILLGVGPGDEVICPALTFVATANAVRYTGADVVFADSIAPTDLTVDPKHMAALITERTKALMVVHYAGFPCHMREITTLAAERGLGVIEDCAHAPLAWTELTGGQRQSVGTLGDVGCFSFFSNKNMTTGEGGMITTDTDDFAEKIRLLRSHGMTTLTADRHKGHASGYDVVTLGHNYRIDEIRSALGLAQLRKLADNNQKRRDVFTWYREALRGNDTVIVPFADRSLDQATPHIMPIIIKEGYETVKQRLREARIQTSKHYDLIPTFSLYRESGFTSRVSDIEKILTLPLHPGMTREDATTIADVVNTAAGGVS